MEENKFVWVLIEDVRMYEESGRKFISVLSTFEKAKTKMQRLIRKHVAADNYIFDGQGHINGLDEFVREYEGEDDDFEFDPKFDEFFRATRGEPSLKPIEAMLNDYFSSEDDYEVDEKLADFFATNHMIECKMKRDADGELSLSLADIETELKCNIEINTFSMNNPEKFYFFRIENEFFDFEDYGSIDITLLRVDLDDWLDDNKTGIAFHAMPVCCLNLNIIYHRRYTVCTNWRSSNFQSGSRLFMPLLYPWQYHLYQSSIFLL